MNEWIITRRVSTEYRFQVAFLFVLLNIYAAII